MIPCFVQLSRDSLILGPNEEKNDAFDENDVF